MIIGVTGHRPSKIGGYNIPNPIYNNICSKLRELLIELKPDETISGMALGVDSWFADICIDLNIPFVAAIPFLGQEKAWPQKSQDKYLDLLSKAKKQHVVCMGNYEAWKLHKRNEWIVDNSDILIAVHIPKSNGGTANCIEYANSKNRQIIRINPLALVA